MNRPNWLLLLPLVVLLTGCGEEQVRVYTVPKESTQPAAPAAAQGGSTPASVTWKTPPGWEERPASGLRVADFLVSDPRGEVASVTITPMSGLRDAEAEIVNMWRQEVALPSLEQEEFNPAPLTIAGRQGELFDLAGDKERILAAVLHDGDQSWFFKMKGPSSLIESQSQTFRQFLQSVEFTAGPARAPTAASAGPAAGGGQARPAWQVPDGWRETPPTSLGLARYVVGDETKPDAEITVTVFPGTAGGPLANINRWRGELGLAPWAALDPSVQRLDQAGPEAMLVEMTGNDTRGGGQPASIVASIVPRSNVTWFYKLKGAPAAVGREKGAFTAFVQSADYSHAP